MAAQPFEIGGREIPVGTMIAPCIYLVHRNPEIYPDPEAFKPERFLGVHWMNPAAYVPGVELSAIRATSPGDGDDDSDS